MMAILAECPYCHRKQATKNKKCRCSGDLDKAKKGKKVKYWIVYRMPDGRQRRESLAKFEGVDPYSITDAREVESKRVVQRREHRVFDMQPESNMTFDELRSWYLGLEKVKALASFERNRVCFENFTSEFGPVLIQNIKVSDIENYQQKRLNQGKAPATVDREVGVVKTAVFRACDDEILGERVKLLFQKVRNVLKRHGNARDVVLSPEQFQALVENSPSHLKGVIACGYYTGMRRAEILGLTWDKVDLENRFIRLEAADTKDREPRLIPICDELYEILKRQPKALHHNHIFTYRGNPITTNFKRSFASACEKAGIPHGRKVKNGITFHDLRHTYVTYMRKAGVAESVIMKITGHSTREMFIRYDKIDADDAKDAMERFSGYLNQSVHQSVDQNVDQKAKKS
jgi:integrase